MLYILCTPIQRHGTVGSLEPPLSDATLIMCFVVVVSVINDGDLGRIETFCVTVVYVVGRI